MQDYVNYIRTLIAKGAEITLSEADTTVKLDGTTYKSKGGSQTFKGKIRDIMYQIYDEEK